MSLVEVDRGGLFGGGPRTTSTTLLESTSAKIHTRDCFHVSRHPRSVYKILFPDATEEQIREYIAVKKLAARCCGSCLAWAVNGG